MGLADKAVASAFEPIGSVQDFFAHDRHKFDVLCFERAVFKAFPALFYTY